MTTPRNAQEGACEAERGPQAPKPSTDSADRFRWPETPGQALAPRLRADINWAYCCPVCADSAEPGEALGWFTDLGLKQHLWDVHGETTP